MHGDERLRGFYACDSWKMQPVDVVCVYVCLCSRGCASLCVFQRAHVSSLIPVDVGSHTYAYRYIINNNDPNMAGS